MLASGRDSSLLRPIRVYGCRLFRALIETGWYSDATPSAGEAAMRRYRHAAIMLAGLCLIALAGCATQSSGTVAQASVPPLQPGQARVWILRQANPPAGNVDAADPMVFANGAPLGQSKEGTAFFHDFPPGSYRFAVQPYGTPTGQTVAMQLAPGMQSYLQVQAAPNWQIGSSVGGGSFTLLVMTPEIAQQYLPTLAYQGQR
jgi:hypothetical protein